MLVTAVLGVSRNVPSLSEDDEEQRSASGPSTPWEEDLGPKLSNV